MVFSGYSNAAYLPLDSDQGVTFYKNENLLFSPPPAAAASNIALVCRRNSSVAEMLTTTTGSGPFGGQPLLHGAHQQRHGNNICDDFQPVAHLSSNGYYGYVPPPANAAAPKVMSTHQAAGTPPHINGHGVGVLLDSIHPAATPTAVAADDSYSMMMDCGNGGVGGEIVQVENYQQQQQQHLRKRKEYSEHVEANCKRRKTWQEQPNGTGFTNSTNWNQPSFHQMECHDQAMDTFSSPLQFHQSPITMNAPTSINAFNGFQHHLQQQQSLILTPPMAASAQPQTILQPKNCLSRASSPSPNKPLGRTELAVVDKQNHQLQDLRHRHSAAGAEDCQMWEDLFISLHGSGFYLAC